LNEEFLKEIEKWEGKVLERVIPRLYKTTKAFRDPRIEKCKDYRNRNRGAKYHYNSESKGVRKMTNRRLRRVLKQRLYEEYYYKIVPHDFKTYGWLTW